MAVKIRLTRLGDKKSPFYRVVVTDSRKARDGAYIENLGTYNPLVNPVEIKINEERAKYWLGVGAEPTETARSLLVKSNILAPKTTKSAPRSDKKKKESK